MNDKHKILGTPFSTAMSATMAQLLGYSCHNGVGFVDGELKALERLYGFDLDACSPELQRVGSQRNMMRLAERDGLRIMAMLARHVEDNEDPVRLVAEGLAALGLDVCIEDDDEE